MINITESFSGERRAYNESVVMLFELSTKSATRCISSHGDAQAPLIDSTRVSLEQLGRDERLKYKETAQVDTARAVSLDHILSATNTQQDAPIYPRGPVVEALVEGRSP